MSTGRNWKPWLRAVSTRRNPSTRKRPVDRFESQAGNARRRFGVSKSRERRPAGSRASDDPSSKATSPPNRRVEHRPNQAGRGRSNSIPGCLRKVPNQGEVRQSLPWGIESDHQRIGQLPGILNFLGEPLVVPRALVATVAVVIAFARFEGEGGVKVRLPASRDAEWRWIFGRPGCRPLRRRFP